MQCKYCSKKLPADALYCCYCGRKQTRSAPHRCHANGDGCAWKRPGKKTWSARVTDMAHTGLDASGKLRRKTIEKSGFPTEKAARDWCRDYYRGKLEKPPAPTLAEVWNMYEQSELETLSKARQDNMRAAWKRAAVLASRRIDTITVADLRDLVAQTAPTEATQEKLKSLLSRLFRLAAADGYCSKDLPSFVIIRHNTEKKEREAFSQEEVAKMWNAWEAEDTFAALPLLMVYTGMMPGEIAKLEATNIDIKHRVITGAGIKTEVRKSAEIVLPEVIVPVVQQLVDNSAENGRIFNHRREHLEKLFHKFTERIGIRDLPPYSCRHTTATVLAVGHGIPAETLRKYMRWSKTSQMPGTYVHPSKDDLLNAAGKLDRPS